MIANPDPESATPTAKEVFGELLAEFGAGWEKGDAARMANQFTPNAVFAPGAFDTPVRGSEAIARYWRDIPKTQAEIRFRAGEVFVAGPWFASEFRCTFRRRRTGEKVEVRGAVFCETESNKISEMRMYFDRATGIGGE